MTIRQMLKKYIQIKEDGYETVTVHQVLNDIQQIRRENLLRREKDG